MTNEKILEIKNELANQGIINPTSDDFKFLKLFEELKEWFKWDIQRFPYKELTDPIGYRYNYKESDIKFYKSNHDLAVFSVMVGINICANKKVLNDVEGTNKILNTLFTSLFTSPEERHFYENYKKICGINTEILGSFVMGMIRNKMDNGTFDEFLVKYNNIIQKYYKTILPIDKDGTIETTATPVDESTVTNQTQEAPVINKNDIIETTATSITKSTAVDKTPVVAPTYQLDYKVDPYAKTRAKSTAVDKTPVVAPTYQLDYKVDPYAKTRAKFRFVPLAHVALQYNPVGCWFWDYQLGIYRSQFVDYHKLNCMEDQITARKYIESITKVMSAPTIYEEILKHMPVVGTKFKDTEPVLLKFISGSSIYSTKYAIGCQYNEHSLVFVCDVITNTVNASYFGKSADVSDAVNNFRV